MYIERGIESKGIRIKLILQSADVETHSDMSSNHEVFEQFADDLRVEAQKMLEPIAEAVPRKRDLPR